MTWEDKKDVVVDDITKNKDSDNQDDKSWNGSSNDKDDDKGKDPKSIDDMTPEELKENLKNANSNMKDFESIKKSNEEAQKLIKKIGDDKKKAAEKDLEDKWEFEKLLNQTKSELEEKTTNMTKIEEENSSMKEKLEKFANNKIAKFKETYGEDKLQEVIAVVWDNPLELSEKLESFEKLLGSPQWKLPADKKWTPNWTWVNRLKELREKAWKEKLNYTEKQEYTKLVAESQKS